MNDLDHALVKSVKGPLRRLRSAAAKVDDNRQYLAFCARVDAWAGPKARVCQEILGCPGWVDEQAADLRRTAREARDRAMEESSMRSAARARALDEAAAAGRSRPMTAAEREWQREVSLSFPLGVRGG